MLIDHDCPHGQQVFGELPQQHYSLKLPIIPRIILILGGTDYSQNYSGIIVSGLQTGVKLIPVSSWTMAQSGSKQIPVVGKEDKREITVLLAATAAGTLLPPQVVYQGKTTGCHAKVTFPEKWHITHSENHWSTEQTMLEYLENIIIPYVTNTRQALDLPEDQRALPIFDVFAAHLCQSVLETNNIHQIFVSASCTGELQPLDVGINDQFKAFLKQEFSRWYANEVQEAMKERVPIKVDLRASLMKPLHANWLMSAMSTLSDKSDAIRKQFETVGIIDYVQ